MPTNESPQITECFDSFGEILAQLGDLFHPDLVGPVGWQHLLRLAYTLPVHVSDYRFGFEFSLADPEPEADFCVVVPPGSRVADFYIGLGKAAAPGTPAEALALFLDRQAKGTEALLSRYDGDMILEYDLVKLDPGFVRPPGIFLIPRSVGEAHALELLGNPDATVNLLWSVAGWQENTAELRQAQRIYEALTPGSFVSQAGVMPARTPRALRFLVRTATIGEALVILEKIKWPGSAAMVDATLTEVIDLVRSVFALSIDVTAEGVSHRLGLELFRPNQRHELDYSGWRNLLDRLTERDWCLPRKGLAMAEWPRVEQLFAQGGVFKIRQVTNHVKLVLDRGEIKAKAYGGIDVLRTA